MFSNKVILARYITGVNFICSILPSSHGDEEITKPSTFNCNEVRFSVVLAFLLFFRNGEGLNRFTTTNLKPGQLVRLQRHLVPFSCCSQHDARNDMVNFRQAA